MNRPIHVLKLVAITSRTTVRLQKITIIDSTKFRYYSITLYSELFFHSEIKIYNRIQDVYSVYQSLGIVISLRARLGKGIVCCGAH